MATRIDGSVTSAPREQVGTPNGAALAAFLGAGIGSFVMGLLVILNEADVYSVPALYPPAGGLSGRSTLAVVAWLLAWLLLHRRWRDRELAPAGPLIIALLLVGLGMLGTFPPLWRLF